MTRPDPILARLAEGIGLRVQSRHAEARTVYEQLWSEIGGDGGNPLHRCTIAHSMADAQEDVTDELRWDLAALNAAHAITDEQVVTAGMDGSAAAFFPSLHLNLAECYRRLGDLEQARCHLARGRQHADALPDGDDASAIRAALDDLAGRLDR